MRSRERSATNHSPRRTPIAQYRLGAGREGFYVEFLAPLTGSGLKRDGSTDATVSTAGITAQRLRHLDVLLTAPWTVQLNEESVIALSAPAELRVANPVSFIAQKLLIHAHRTPPKQAQDMLYVHDILQLFGEHLEALRDLWNATIQPTMTKNALGLLQKNRVELFAEVTDVTRRAARIPVDRVLLPKQVRRACALGIDEIFGVN